MRIFGAPPVSVRRKFTLVTLVTRLKGILSHNSHGQQHGHYVLPDHQVAGQQARHLCDRHHRQEHLDVCLHLQGRAALHLRADGRRLRLLRLRRELRTGDGAAHLHGRRGLRRERRRRRQEQRRRRRGGVAQAQPGGQDHVALQRRRGALRAANHREGHGAAGVGGTALVRAAASTWTASSW